jgi:tetratricopeptide (TPR) repeat protein
MVKSAFPGLRILATIAIVWMPSFAVAAETAIPQGGRAANDNPSLESLNATLQQNPQDLEAYVERGLLHAKLNRHQAAIADYTEIIRLDPNHALAYNNRAVAKLNLKDYWGAYQDYTQVVRIRPTQAITHNNRAIVRQKLGDCKGAIADLRIAAELFRQQGDQYNYQRTLANLKYFQKSSRS